MPKKDPPPKVSRDIYIAKLQWTPLYKDGPCKDHTPNYIPFSDFQIIFPTDASMQRANSAATAGLTSIYLRRR